MTLVEAQKIFEPEFIGRLTKLLINGNFGDMVMNPDTVPILEYFRKHLSPDATIRISTNGGARNAEFWTRLAELNVDVDFCIDGLEDTHSIYRQNTVYSTVLNNAKTFIQAGGRAFWRWIPFDHNQHQKPIAQALAKELGFYMFEIRDHGRNTGPIYNKKGELTGILGEPDITEFKVVWDKQFSDLGPADPSSFKGTPNGPISCLAKKNRNVYINSIGEVYPCCWIGFNPLTYGTGTYNWANLVNTQLRPLVGKNSALEYPLSECIEWFNSIEDTWQHDTFANGRLLACDAACGAKNKG
jgi:hypothetical protein